MMTLDEKFLMLQADNAPGQEVRQEAGAIETIIEGKKLGGIPVDFSHGDVDVHPPTPDSDAAWNRGFKKGGCQAYTEYRGALEIRNELAERLGHFTGKPIMAESEIIITPGTQGALFLALGATVSSGTKVAIVEPDYFANRKAVQFFDGEIIPVPLNYEDHSDERGIDLHVLETAFINGAKVFVFSTPNNPTGLVFSKITLNSIAALAEKYNVTVIVDQLYSRMLYEGEDYSHFRSSNSENVKQITLMGPSKTESLSGFRLGVAFGSADVIEKMERLQAIVSLRAAGYSQAALDTWFNEPEGWMSQRIIEHQAIRDELLEIFNGANFETATPQAGSYLFPKLPPLKVDLYTFVKLLRIQARVTVTPGTEFAPQFTSHIRLNFSQDHNAAVDGARRIVKMVEIYSQKTEF